MDKIIVGHKGCSIEKVLLTIMATPPEISVDNIEEIMRSLSTPQDNKHKVSRQLAASTYTKYDALYEILCEWVARKSINATMEVLIFDLKKCYLNSYADALDFKFTNLLNRKISVASESTLDNFSNYDYDCQSTVNSDQPFFHPISIENPQSSQLNFKARSRICILSCLTIILLALTATLFVMMLQNFGLFQTNEQVEKTFSYDTNFSAQIVSDTTEISSFVITNFTRQGRICPESKDKINISVTTYEKFRQHNLNLSRCDLISLHVDISSQEVWPENLNITPMGQIIDVSLSGPFSIAKIIHILKILPEISLLRLNNIQNKLCLENSHHNSLLENVRDCNINHNNLNKLHLLNFVDCEYVFDMLLTCAKLKLSHFEFSGEITDANAQQLFHIMQGSHNTLKEIKISGKYATNLNILPLNTPMYFLDTLSIIVDPKNKHYEYNTLLNEHFCKVFTRINIIVLKGQKFTYQQLLYLQNCKELKELTIFVGFSLGATNISELLPFSDWFPRLVRLDIELNFNQCPDTNKSDLLIQKLRQIKRVRVCSNCELCRNRRRGSKNNAQKTCLNLNTIVK